MNHLPTGAGFLPFTAWSSFYHKLGKRTTLGYDVANEMVNPHHYHHLLLIHCWKNHAELGSRVLQYTTLLTDKFAEHGMAVGCFGLSPCLHTCTSQDRSAPHSHQRDLGRKSAARSPGQLEPESWEMEENCKKSRKRHGNISTCACISFILIT